jgi:hypothetical protein
VRIAFSFGHLGDGMLEVMTGHVEDWCRDQEVLRPLFADLLRALETERGLRAGDHPEHVGDFELAVEDVGLWPLRWGGRRAEVERNEWASVEHPEAAEVWNLIFEACGRAYAALLNAIDPEGCAEYLQRPPQSEPPHEVAP